MDFHHLQENINQLLDTGLEALKTASKIFGNKIADAVTAIKL